MIRLDAATVLLQWSVGGLFFLWVTTRSREVGIGYGWLLRGVYLLVAVGAAVVGISVDPEPVRDGAAIAVALASAAALVVSIFRRKAGVRGEHELRARRAERVRAMTAAPGAHLLADTRPALDADAADGTSDATVAVDDSDSSHPELDRSEADRSELDRPRLLEFPPQLDLIAPLVGLPGLVAAAVAAGGPAPLSIARVVVSAAFLGAVSDAMLLGHWYLVQPGLARRPLLELVRWTALTWPAEVLVLLWPTGMVSVLNGSVDDGWDGTLGWFWVACAITTIGLVFVTRAALKERYYSAVMAATGLLYLAILTAFGTDLVARAVLAG